MVPARVATQTAALRRSPRHTRDLALAHAGRAAAESDPNRGVAVGEDAQRSDEPQSAGDRCGQDLLVKDGAESVARQCPPQRHLARGVDAHAGECTVVGLVPPAVLGLRQLHDGGVVLDDGIGTGGERECTSVAQRRHEVAGEFPELSGGPRLRGQRRGVQF